MLIWQKVISLQGSLSANIAAPNTSEATIENALADLLKQGHIEKVGAGRGVSYVMKN